MTTSTKQIILIALSALLVVLFLFMPEQPSAVRNKLESSDKPVENKSVEERVKSPEEQVENAMQKVNGAAPMEGIMELLDIVKRDSTQVDAQYYLGVSSMRSGQYDKAVNRFEKVIKFAGLKKFPDSRLKLAAVFYELGRMDEAKEQVTIFETEYKGADDRLKQEALDLRERLRI